MVGLQWFTWTLSWTALSTDMLGSAGAAPARPSNGLNVGSSLWVCLSIGPSLSSAGFCGCVSVKDRPGLPSGVIQDGVTTRSLPRGIPAVAWAHPSVFVSEQVLWLVGCVCFTAGIAGETADVIFDVEAIG